MSEAALRSLRDYLYFALSPSDRKWLLGQLSEQVRQEEEPLKPYTMEEIHQMIAEGERQFRAGEYKDSEDVFRGLDAEFADEELQLEMAEAV